MCKYPVLSDIYRRSAIWNFWFPFPLQYSSCFPFLSLSDHISSPLMFCYSLFPFSCTSIFFPCLPFLFQKVTLRFCENPGDPAFSVGQNVDDFGDHLDDQRLATMRLSRDAQMIRIGHSAHYRDTAVRMCTRRWQHQRGRCASELVCYLSNTDLQSVRWYKMSGYERLFGYIATNISSVNQAEWAFMLDYVFAISLAYGLFSPLWSDHIWRRIWISKWICTAVAVSFFLAGIMWRPFCPVLNSVTICT